MDGIKAVRFVALCLAPLVVLFNERCMADDLTDALISYAKHDYPHAMPQLTALAERGNAVAQATLGMSYLTARGIPRDSFAAVHLLKRAAEQNEIEAQFTLGEMYRDGVGTAADSRLALLWFRRAATGGAAHAFNAIGELYIAGLDAKPDYARAIGWFLRGADLDNSTAMYNLGMRHALGQGIPADEIEAYKWFELAAHTGAGHEREIALQATQALAERMTPLEIEHARSRMKEWLASRHSPKTDMLAMMSRRPRPEPAAARPAQTRR